MANHLPNTTTLLRQYQAQAVPVLIALEADLDALIAAAEKKMLNLTSEDMALNYHKLQAERQLLINMRHAIINVNK